MTPPAIRIRWMRQDDAVAVAELTTQLGYPVDGEAQRARIAEVLATTGDHAALVATDGEDRPIGWIHVERLRYLEADATAQIMGMVVDESHRSGGVGAALLEAAEAWAVQAGCRRMTVRSRVQREGAHRFYERNGYVNEKTSYVFRKQLG